MILAVLLAVLLVLVLLVGLAALLGAGARRTTPLLVLGVAGLGAFVLAVVVLVLAIGVAGDGHPRRASATTVASTAGPEETRVTSGPVLLVADAWVRAFDDAEFPPRAATVDSVADGQMVVVGMTGFEAATTGSVHQCPAGATAVAQCRGGLPVTFDGSGEARVGVEVTRHFQANDGRTIDCGERTRLCAVVVFGVSRGQAFLAFGGPAAPDPLIRVSPARVAPGGKVEVAVTGAAPGQAVILTHCSSRSGAGFSCRRLTGPRYADGKGSLTAEVVIRADGCRRGHPCAVAAISADGTVQLALTRLAITGRPGAEYNGRRLVSGLLVAATLLVLAGVLLGRTDWMAVEGDPFAGIDLPKT